ncbi:response regulator receiver (plasmid) [Gemmatirosa kalamazoonensis]|uniref:Response regulator receiver n=1 Tax=Gemmatirosa kalamazoonensis TaxID=861299 RepID=W0RUI1_9BACT|nr:response regulator transcription factor [Gemmatirosa kalamazoonensis]AHG93213.1 response regulator receiver [Gemmatirosa kalamazoonensis]
MSVVPPAGSGSADSLQAVAAALAARPYARRGVSLREAPVRVVLVDDHAVLRVGLRALLEKTPDVTVVGDGSNGVEAVALAEQLAPDVVVLDLDMPGGDGATATRALCALEHPPKVLILSMHAEEDQLIPLLKDGATGYLSKEAAGRELVAAIRVVASGDTYVRPHVARLLAGSVRQSAAPDARRLAFQSLSEREQRVVTLMAEGYSGVEIGQQLDISPKTVDTYKQRIEKKLGITHRTEYVRLALSLDLIRK